MFEGIRGISLKSNHISALSIALCITIFASCESVFEVEDSASTGRRSTRFAGTNQALVYLDNPTVLAGKTNYESVPDIRKKLTAGVITANNELSSTCSFKQSTSTSTHTFCNDI